MGFGCLLVGYFFANMMPPGGTPLSIAKLIGYPLMIAAFYRLAPYHKRFLYCFFASLATLPFAVYYALYALSVMGVVESYAFLSGMFYSVVGIVYLAVSLAVHLLMLLAVSALCRELGLTAIRGYAWRSVTFVAAYFLLRFVMMIPVAWLQKLLAPTLLVWLCMVFLNLFLIFKCYRHICPEGDEYMPDRTQPKKTGKGIEDE